MKSTLLLSLCLAQMAFVSIAFASTNTVDTIDNEQEAELQPGGARVYLTGEPVADAQVASNDGSTGASSSNCRTISGIASIYGLNHGRGDGAHQALAGGGKLDTTKLTAAMLPVYHVNQETVKVPLHKIVEVSGNGHTIKVLVNDRGPYAKGRKIDLTPAAAHGLGFSENGAGLAHVQIKVCN